MRLVLPALMTLALAGCSIQSNTPEYEYPAASDASGPDWPDLAVTSELVAAGQNTQTTASDNQAATERLAARARALRERVKRLKRETAN